MKRFIATSNNEYEEINAELITGEEKELYSIGEIYLQEYPGFFVTELFSEKYRIIDYIAPENTPNGSIDLVIPEKIWTKEHGWRPVGYISVGSPLSLSNNFTSNEKIKTLTIKDGGEPIQFGYGFHNNPYLEKVHIDAKIITSEIALGNQIGYFENCTNLKEVYIRDMNSLSARMFYDCFSLDTFNFPDTIRLVMDYCMAYTKITEVTFNNPLCEFRISTTQNPNWLPLDFMYDLEVINFNGTKLNWIAKDGNAPKVHTLNLGNNLIYMRFSEIPDLVEEISLPASFIQKEVGYGGRFGMDFNLSHSSHLKAIHVDPDNLYFADIDGVLVSKDLTKLFCVPPHFREGLHYDLPNSIDGLGRHSNYSGSYISGSNFLGTKIKSLSRPNLLNNDPNYLRLDFTYSGLEEYDVLEGDLFLPNFSNSSIKKINFLEDNILTVFANNNFLNTDLSLMTKEDWPENITSIGTSCFKGSKMTEFKWPDSINTIPYGCFDECEFLEDFEIITEGKTLSNYTFRNCVSLYNFDFEKIYSIGTDAFAGNNMGDVIISDNLTGQVGGFRGATVNNFTVNNLGNKTVSLAGITVNNSLVIKNGTITTGLTVSSYSVGYNTYAETVILEGFPNYTSWPSIGGLNCNELIIKDFKGQSNMTFNSGTWLSNDINHVILNNITDWVTITGSSKSYSRSSIIRAVTISNCPNLTNIGTPGMASNQYTINARSSVSDRVNFLEFNNCPNLTTINEYGLQHWYLNSFTIPETITTIKDGAFNTSYLNQIYIPNTVITMGQRIFVKGNNTVDDLIINCQPESKPEGWDQEFNSRHRYLTGWYFTTNYNQ